MLEKIEDNNEYLYDNTLLTQNYIKLKSKFENLKSENLETKNKVFNLTI